jgi:hypothetical protein
VKLYLLKSLGKPFALLLLAFALGRCANPMAPDGGERDEQPPQVVEEESSPNYQTNFKKQPIRITFDEWVEIKDAFNQVVISPPLAYSYELSIKKRSVLFEFDEREELRDSATYTINFGEAVQDFTEGNPAENLRFVFSTGPYIDSLSVSGKIVDARTYKPVAEALFMLYENTADSVVRTDRPFYFARTDDNGRFLIENVKAGTFKGFALLDNNLNYLFDQAQEAIGFPDSLLEVQAGQEPEVGVRLFIAEQPIRLLDADDTQYGKVKLIFNRKPEQVQFSYQDVGHRQLLFDINPDTTFVWYELPGATPWAVYLQKDTVLNDTVEIEAREREAFLETAKLRMTEGPKRSIKPSGPITLSFNHPLLFFDTAQMQLLQDTTETVVQPTVRIDTSGGKRQLQLDHKWKPALPYQLQLLPGAVRDMYGLENDTLQLEFKAGVAKAYGNLLLTVDSLSADSAYVIELLSGEETVREFEVDNSTQFQTELKLMEPGSYTVRLIEDWNRDGRWTSGDYRRYRQPEPIFTRPLEQLRANWDLETVVDLRTLQAKAAQVFAPPAPATAVPQVNTDSLRRDSIRQQQLPKSVRDRVDDGN